MAQIHRGKDRLGEKLRKQEKTLHREQLKQGAHTAGGLLAAVAVTLGLFGLFYLLREPITALTNGILAWLDAIELPLLMGLVLLVPKLALGALAALWPFLLPPLAGLITLGVLTEDGGEKTIRQLKKQVAVTEAGTGGEELAEVIIGRLDDSCHVFTNCIVPCRGRTSETDFIVVSPAGVSIVEVKNHSGTFGGRVDDPYLIRSRKGDSEKVDNPVLQVAGHADRLAGFLAVNGISCPIATVVFYVNAKAAVYLDKSRDVYSRHNQTLIFTYPEQQALLDALNAPAGSSALGQARRQKIVRLLDVLVNDHDLLPACDQTDVFTREKAQKAAAKYDTPLEVAR